MSELEFKPDFEKGNGLLPVITQDVLSNEVLMLAYMNKALRQVKPIIIADHARSYGIKD